MTMAMRRVMLVVAAVLALPAQAGAAEPAVEVFTLSTLPLTNARDATVRYVDALALLEQHLSMSLPPDPARAQQLVAQRMTALGPDLQSRARAGATALARAAQLGVQRAPAIVFEGKWAVYGITDVDTARRVFARFVPDTRR